MRPSSIDHPPIMCGGGGDGSGCSEHFQFLLPIHCSRTFSRRRFFFLPLSTLSAVVIVFDIKCSYLCGIKCEFTIVVALVFCAAFPFSFSFFLNNLKPSPPHQCRIYSSSPRMCTTKCESVNKKLENAFVMLLFLFLQFYCLMPLYTTHFIYSVHAWFNNSTVWHIYYTQYALCKTDKDENNSLCLDSSHRCGMRGVGANTQTVSYLIFRQCVNHIGRIPIAPLLTPFKTIWSFTHLSQKKNQHNAQEKQRVNEKRGYLSSYTNINAQMLSAKNTINHSPVIVETRARISTCEKIPK